MLILFSFASVFYYRILVAKRTEEGTATTPLRSLELTIYLAIYPWSQGTSSVQAHPQPRGRFLCPSVLRSFVKFRRRNPAPFHKSITASCSNLNSYCVAPARLPQRGFSQFIALFM